MDTVEIKPKLKTTMEYIVDLQKQIDALKLTIDKLTTSTNPTIPPNNPVQPVKTVKRFG